MNIESKIWRRRNPDATIVNKLSEDLGITRISSQILANRGLKTTEDAERFLNPNIEDLHDAFLLKGMTEAVERIHNAIEKKNRYGSMVIMMWMELRVSQSCSKHFQHLVIL